MEDRGIVEKTEHFCRSQLAQAEGGHDWSHVMRVLGLARTLARDEGAIMLVVELAVLLHDVADSKFHGGDHRIGAKVARDFLATQGVEPEVIDHVAFIVEHMSYSAGLAGSLQGHPLAESIEFKVVQDADRLDALGAVGIARTFNYGGHKGRALYDPAIPPQPDQSATQYQGSTAPTINHFYEKLLLLADTMHTKTGRRLARERHRFMEAFLAQFYAEWEGER